MATIMTRLTPADHGRRMSLSEFLEAEVEEGYRYELARGVVEVTNVPNDNHGLVVSNLYLLIIPYLRAHRERFFRVGGGGEFQLVMPGMNSGRNPDFAITLQGTAPDHRGRRPPSFVVEVTSPRSGERDRIAKREEYLAFGIQEYWIVDPSERKLVILTREGDVWREQVCQGDQPIVSLFLPGLEGAVADLWIGLAEIDAGDDD